MIEFNNVKIFTDNIDYETLGQLHTLDKTGIFKDLLIRIMPDCHAGKGSVIGFTCPIQDKVVPNIVGVDICCGMYVVELGQVDVDLAKLDEVVHTVVPSGMTVGSRSIDAAKIIAKLRCYDSLKNLDWLESSLGTLGGGNHFIELDVDEQGNKYLIIHTGSRNLGKQVAEIYQEKAIKHCRSKHNTDIIEQLKREGRHSEIQSVLETLKNSPKIPNDLCYIEGDDLEDYLYDMAVCKEFANRNRELIAANILCYLGLQHRIKSAFTVLHNYISTDRVIRKGAIYAGENVRVLIPLNMRDGCILGVGKGNADWNYSAPHGAGRIMSRSQAKRTIQLADFEESMKNVYSTTVNNSTIDEAPFAYKPSQEIIDSIRDTVEIEKILKPIYNYKSGD